MALQLQFRLARESSRGLTRKSISCAGQFHVKKCATCKTDDIEKTSLQDAYAAGEEAG